MECIDHEIHRVQVMDYTRDELLRNRIVHVPLMNLPEAFWNVEGL